MLPPCFGYLARHCSFRLLSEGLSSAGNIARHKLSSCGGGKMNAAPRNASKGNSLLGTVWSMDNTSASSLCSAGRCVASNSRLAKIFLRAISRKILFIVGLPEDRLRASLREPRLSPLPVLELLVISSAIIAKQRLRKISSTSIITLREIAISIFTEIIPLDCHTLE